MQALALPPTSHYESLVHGWQSMFRITSEVVTRRGRPWLGGYISSDYGFTATRMRLLIDGVDQAGRTVSQSVSWLGSPIPPGARVYFEVPAPQPGVSYRVSVLAFDSLQTASVEAP
jgi:hypothetical protein